MAEHHALIVDDEPDIRELLEITLGRMKIDTTSAPNLTEARAALESNEFDLCLTDMNLPDGNGIELVKHISEQFPELPVAMITAYGSMDSAIAALKAGAFDFVSKPVNLEQLRNLVDQALRLQKPAGADPAESVDAGSERLLGKTDAMALLRRQISKLARSQAPIYITGESGAGKELAAREIHEQGPRAGHPFVAVNCGAIPSELMESEFFGHKKGSFTGAVEDKEGLFQAANGGTLFLDEVADLPLQMQVKLLRAIQEKAVRPIGEQKEISIDVRLLSATHKDLAAEVESQRFRQDLYYRINVIELAMPPLRERLDDLPILAEFLMQRLAEKYQMEVPRVSDAALAALRDYHFPGNVRELENILERAFTLCEGDEIMPDDLQMSPAESAPTPAPAVTAEESPAPADEPIDAEAAPPESAIESADSPLGSGALPARGEDESLEDYLEDIEKNVIMEALEETRWNKTAAAKKLGITFRALRYRLKKLGLE